MEQTNTKVFIASLVALGFFDANRTRRRTLDQTFRRYILSTDGTFVCGDIVVVIYPDKPSEPTPKILYEVTHNTSVTLSGADGGIADFSRETYDDIGEALEAVLGLLRQWETALGGPPAVHRRCV